MIIIIIIFICSEYNKCRYNEEQMTNLNRTTRW